MWLQCEIKILKLIWTSGAAQSNHCDAGYESPWLWHLCTTVYMYMQDETRKVLTIHECSDKPYQLTAGYLPWTLIWSTHCHLLSQRKSRRSLHRWLQTTQTAQVQTPKHTILILSRYLFFHYRMCLVSQIKPELGQHDLLCTHSSLSYS